MAYGAIENTIYVNQQTASVSSEHTARNSRLDMQNFAAGLEVNKEKKEVQEVRPAEENQKIDEDRDNQPREEKQNSSSKKNRKKKCRDFRRK